MSDIPQLVAAIDGRLADLVADITTLEAAKAALDGSRSGDRVSAVATTTTATRSRHRSTPRRRTVPATVTDAPQPVVVAPEEGSARTQKRVTPKVAAKAKRSRRAGAVVGAETLERLLADTSAGFSATAIAEQVGASYNQTLRLLRELEVAGQVRRSGSRRTTVWRLITDEERIAERAAELERRSGVPGQRRGRARAS